MILNESSGISNLLQEVNRLDFLLSESVSIEPFVRTLIFVVVVMAAYLDQTFQSFHGAYAM